MMEVDMWRLASHTTLVLMLMGQVLPSLELTFVRHDIQQSYPRPWSISAADVDGDSDMDVVSHAYEGQDISWWENNGSQSFTRHTIASPILPLDIQTCDLDGDGDVDVVAALYGENRYAWYENDGSGHFTGHTIGNWNGPTRSFVVDLDQDGDMDVLAVACVGYPFGPDQLEADDLQAGRMGWFENDGNENFTQHILKDGWDHANSVHAADLDGDADLDVIATAGWAHQLCWFENDGNQNFTEHVIISGWGSPGSAWAVDLDQDGDADLLATACNVGQVAWFENDSSHQFTQHIIASGFQRPHMVRPADLDQDGDIDLVTTAVYGNEIAWFENQGDQTFVKHVIAGNYSGACGICLVDLDKDNDVDILSAGDLGYRISWWEQVAAGIAEELPTSPRNRGRPTVLSRSQAGTLPPGCRMLDACGRVVPAAGRPGVYFLQSGGRVVEKVLRLD
jgi:hypothetical protein